MSARVRWPAVGKALLFIILVVAAIGGAAAYWQYASRTRSTDDAYVNAEIAQISSQVSGRVIGVHVKESQFVHKGDPLFDVDPAPFQVAVDRARAQLDLARQGSRQDLAEVQAIEADLGSQRTNLANAEISRTRAQSLVAKGFLSRQAIDDATAKVDVSRAAVEQAQARLQKALAALASAGKLTPAVAAAVANLKQAELDLSNTHVIAPRDGWVVNKTLTAGTSVTPGQPLFGLIVDRSFWVDANLKETELSGVRPGQAAEIEVDLYPGHVFAGRVESISGGTGTAFSLLPAQNATGNWVKVTQRVPVKVRFDGFDPRFPLRVGVTASVTLHVN